MNLPQSHNHHYVPQWYQKRFLPTGHSKLFYLDLKPQKVENGEHSYFRRNPQRAGVVNCFCQDDLYAMRFGKETTDILETKLFGIVDKKGAPAAAFFSEYRDYVDATVEMFRDLVFYMGAQRFRTPRGLDLIKKQYGLGDHTQALIIMNRLFQAYGTMWSEGIWEIVHARQSTIKFIISDDPVTFFNRRVIPGGPPYPFGADLPQAGTRTIFPLSPESCLIISHLQLARNAWTNPAANRENARTFDRTIANLTQIQFGRELDESEVLKINLILKKSAKKFIASGEEELLYPEKHVDIHWTKLDDDWFLFPNLCKVKFSAGTFMGFKNGSVFGRDEYGRRPGHPRYEDEEMRQFDFQRAEESKKEWVRRRFQKPVSHLVNQMREDTMGDLRMERYLRELELIPAE
ncbi:MAG TPA: DUF4238 domain-containing protein [Candidatus Acidoferrales bacterium]|nr:DUF4238 domain-containing protein [Candidatus Acidoferrales bacterium]